MPRVRLADIIDAIEMEFEEAASFPNFDTGQVETLSHELLRRAEEYDGSDPPDLLTWQEAEWEWPSGLPPRSVSSNSRPDSTCLSGRSCAISVPQWVQKASVTRARCISEFKEIVRLQGIELEWFAFRADALARIARDWCDEHGVVYE